MNHILCTAGQESYGDRALSGILADRGLYRDSAHTHMYTRATVISLTNR